MTTGIKTRVTKGLSLAILTAFTLSACETGIDLGGYNLTNGGERVAPRPAADSRGVISYPTYQVVVARQGDTVIDVAKRIGMPAKKLADHNGLGLDQALRRGELLAIPGRVKTGATGVDITTIASTAISDADARAQSTGPPPKSSAIEPIRHRVERGETAYSIARLYDVSVTALASWNGLGTDLSVREGQQLLIPIVETPAPRVSDASKPGKGTATPTPPSASKPLPKKVTKPKIPTSPDLGKLKTASDDGKFLMPVTGKIIAAYSGKAGGNEGIDIAASKGTAVKSADDGEVALISKSVGSNTIVLIRHAGNIYTVYSNVTDVKLTKGQKIKRGQRIGGVAAGSPSYLHFEVREGTKSVDPAPFLK
ncbi:MAG: peptidoglycan DD-metalloendopeptidase family protein [Alphaproteobacteria bacterium]|nr:peptidoglycan DD-metalloendopeptidase family protein [Alphaproteobacteria bacterium]